MNKKLVKALCVVVGMILIIPGCGNKSEPVANLTVPEQILEHFKTVVKSDDSAVIRDELGELDRLAKDTTLSDEESLFAQYTYNISYGVAQLMLSEEGFSAFEFPDIEILCATVGAIAKNELEISDIMISESQNFVQRVEKYLR